jgi:mono/diheme cytochrome c family protein/uncharacterized membrane protein
MPDIPNFTEASWQGRRSEAQLLASILDGKGQDMPPFRGKVTEDQARSLVTHVRGFAPTTPKSGPDKQQKGTSANGFEEEFRRLRQELEELKKQSRERPEGSVVSERSRPAEPSLPSPPAKPPETSPPSPPSKSPSPPSKSPPAAAEAAADSDLFGQHCAKCHGADGTGKPRRGRLPTIPDFTAVSWQQQRSDEQLLRSILDGKGKEMPSFGDKLSEEQASGLLAQVRAFAPTGTKSIHEEQEEPSLPEVGDTAEVRPPGGFFAKVIGWLGRFHPAAVHFPIALLTAAAVAELLRLITAQPAFDAVSRFCVWFGALGALGAGTLGWFAGGFSLTDESWVLMTHRWLGTGTVAWAGLVLVLSEMSWRPDRRGTRLGFRATLFVGAALVLATGFFGGAVVNGLAHYTWPP